MPVIEKTFKKVTLKRAPRFCNVLYNNNHTTMDLVIIICNQVFGLSMEESKRKTLEIHESGKAIIFINSKEVCEHKDALVSNYCRKYDDNLLKHSINVYDNAE